MNYIFSSLIFFFVCGFRVSISLCHPSCRRTYYVDQAVLNLQRSACLCLLSARIKSVHQHTHPRRFSFAFTLTTNRAEHGMETRKIDRSGFSLLFYLLTR